MVVVGVKIELLHRRHKAHLTMMDERQSVSANALSDCLGSIDPVSRAMTKGTTQLLEAKPYPQHFT